MKKLLLSIVFILGMGRVSHAQVLVPQIAYNGSVIGQVGTDNIGVVYTTPSEGLYRLSGSTLSQTCSPQIVISWGGQNQAELGITSLYVFVIAASTDISLKYQVAPSCSTVPYDAFVTIEKIG